MFQAPALEWSFHLQGYYVPVKSFFIPPFTLQHIAAKPHRLKTAVHRLTLTVSQGVPSASHRIAAANVSTSKSSIARTAERIAAHH